MGFDKCLVLCIQHYNITENSFIILKNPVLHLFNLPYDFLTTTDVFTISIIILSFRKYHKIGIIQYVAFSYWLLSTSNTHLRFTHVFLWLTAHSFFIAEQQSILQIYCTLFMHSPMEGHLGCFQFLIIINKPSINIHVHVHVQA